jgi:hypothetical protein
MTATTAAFSTPGHKLFNTSHETFPVPCIFGDIFDPLFLSLSESSQASTVTETPDLQKASFQPLTHANLCSLNTLTPLQGHATSISVCNLFPLFPFSVHLSLARRIASLLSPKKGAMIFGHQVGMPKKGVVKTIRDSDSFCWDVEGWKALWAGGDPEGSVFRMGEVEVWAELGPFVQQSAVPRPTVPSVQTKGPEDENTVIEEQRVKSVPPIGFLFWYIRRT